MKDAKPYPFQVEGVKQIARFGGRALLADELGLGKTFQALYYAWKYLPDDPPGPVVVVPPAHLKIHWQREAAKHLGLRAEILSGQRRPGDKLPPLDRNCIFVVNYDVLVPPHWPARTQPPADSWVGYLSALNPRLLIADEGHYLTNPSSARTRAVRWLARRCPHVLILTGTPLTNKPPGLWPLLNIIDPAQFPSHFEFASSYSHACRRFGQWHFHGARDLDLLHSRLKRSCLVRRRKADVLHQLPAITHTVVPVEVDLTEYRRAEKDFLGWLESESPALARRAAKVEELARIGYLKRLAGRLKLDAMKQWVGDFLESSDSKLLFGALHYAVTEPLLDHFGRSAVLVDGRMSAEKKQVCFDRFNRDPRCRVLFGNVQAAGTGWSSTSTANAALGELPWNPADAAQFFGRIHGIERGIPGTAAQAWWLVAADTIEADLCDVLQRKTRWAAAAIDGDPGAGELPVHDQVISLMRRRAAG